VQRAVPRRRDEFATGRWCARHALAQLDVAPGPIAVGPWRNPAWPEEVTGSISHTTEICAAVVARCTTWRVIGIDMLDRTAAASLPADAVRLVTREPAEHSLPPAAPAWVPPLALLFSAKESAIKALSPTLRRFVDFPEIRLRFEPQTFAASMDGGHPSVQGWWTTVMDTMIVTGAVLL